MYTLNRTNPNNPPIEVEMSVLKNQGGLTWVGQYHTNWGEVLHTNSLRLLENFAGEHPPYYNDDVGVSFNKIQGTLWYNTKEPDTLTPNLSLHTGGVLNDGWTRLQPIIKGIAPVNLRKGEQWFNTNDSTFSIATSDNVVKDLWVKNAYNANTVGNLEPNQFLRRDINDTALGNLQLSNIAPRSDKLYNIGSSSLFWNNAFIDNLVANTTHTLTPKTDNLYDFGTSARRYRTIFAHKIDSNKYTNITPDTSSNNIGGASNRWNTIYATNIDTTNLSTVLPLVTTSNLGSSAKKWNSHYVVNLFADKTDNLIPSATNSKTLGSSSFVWNDIYVNNVKTNIATLNIEPTTTNTSNIGSVTKKYNAAYINNINTTTMSGFNLPIPATAGDSQSITFKSPNGNGFSIFGKQVTTGGVYSLRTILENGSTDADVTYFSRVGSTDTQLFKIGKTHVRSSKPLQANSGIQVSNAAFTAGVTMLYNADLNAMEFTFS